MANTIAIVLALVVALACIVWGVIAYQRAARLERLVRALLSSQGQVLLLYDEKDRLIFDTAGLVLFDNNAKRPIRRLKQRPMPGHESRGEMDIDGNRYRYRSKLLEFKPETFGTVVILDYQGPESAKK